MNGQAEHLSIGFKLGVLKKTGSKTKLDEK